MRNKVALFWRAGLGYCFFNCLVQLRTNFINDAISRDQLSSYLVLLFYDVFVVGLLSSCIKKQKQKLGVKNERNKYVMFNQQET